MSDAAIQALVDTINALIAVMEEESEALALHGPVGPIAELAQAKARLAARMDQMIAALNREAPGWHTDMAKDDRASLASAYSDLHSACAVNSDILERQIDLSSEMLSAVGLEIERLTGHGSTTYGRGGKVRTAKGRPPMSINTRL